MHVSIAAAHSVGGPIAVLERRPRRRRASGTQWLPVVLRPSARQQAAVEVASSCCPLTFRAWARAMLPCLLPFLAGAAAAADAVCYRRGAVDLARCDASKEPWWTVYTYTSGEWTEHVGVNCVAPRVAGPDPFSASISLAGCKAACKSDPSCHAIVVPTPGVPNPRPPSGPPGPPPPPQPPGPPLPGLADVCAHLNPSETCSPEICELQPHTTVRLEPKVYYQNTSIVLPEGVQLIGAGINKTIVIACGAPSSGRRGFILGNNTYLGHYTWQGLQAHRGNFDAAVGTPGCLQPHDDGYPKHPFVCSGGFIPPDGDGAGVQNATVEHVHVRPYVSGDGDLQWPLSTSAGWFPHTMPWGPKQHTGSHNITVRGIINWGTWADGINFHGGKLTFYNSCGPKIQPGTPAQCRPSNWCLCLPFWTTCRAPQRVD